MKKHLPVVVCMIVAFALGVGLQRCVLSKCLSRPADGVIDPAAVQLRAEWADVEGDNASGDLVLLQDGQVFTRWPLGSIWMDDWLDVPIHHTAVRDTRTWWLSWRAGSGTGHLQHDGAVVWFPDGKTPAFWSGVWARTESYRGDEPYEYRYWTTVVPTPGRGSRLGLQVRLEGKGLGLEHNHATVFCAAEQQADGSWRFIADDMNRLHIERMLAAKSLSGIHEQLREFLPAD